jgi:hypothetical protein
MTARDHVVLCPYCGERAECVDSSRVYGRSFGSMIWLCDPCDAYVGCHKNSPTHAPLGTLAQASLRKLRKEVHNLLDPIWKLGLQAGEKDARRRTYTWLATQLGLPAKRCHVAEFDLPTCVIATGVLKGVTWEVVKAATEVEVFRRGALVVVERGGESQTGVVVSGPLRTPTTSGAQYSVVLDGQPGVHLIPDTDLDHAPIIDSIARLADDAG